MTTPTPDTIDVAREAAKEIDDAMSISAGRVTRSGESEEEVTLEKAIKLAEDCGMKQVYQTSKSWLHRGIRTDFEDTDPLSDDWEVVWPATSGTYF